MLWTGGLINMGYFDSVLEHKEKCFNSENKDDKSTKHFDKIYDDDILDDEDLTNTNSDENEDDDDITEPIELILSNTREFNQSIGFSYFFLSKLATRIRNVFFPKDHSDIWERCDILITADAKLLESKPDGKVAIKIVTDYNKNCPADYEYNSMLEFINDKEIIHKILK